jgi:hypothetical protein
MDEDGRMVMRKENAAAGSAWNPYENGLNRGKYVKKWMCIAFAILRVDIFLNTSKLIS